MFTGFSPETVDFLWGIRMNNNREWFLDNKKNYVNFLYEPMKALGRQLYEPFMEGRTGDICKVSRIYRDARMHHDLPYKESLWVCIRQDGQWWDESGCLYCEINPEGVDYGFFLYKPRPAAMEALRKHLAANPAPFLNMIKSVEEATGERVTAQCYKRPKPCDNPELAPYFAWKEQISCSRHEDFGDDVFSPELARRIALFFQQALPLYDYFNTFKY